MYLHAWTPILDITDIALLWKRGTLDNDDDREWVLEDGEMCRTLSEECMPKDSWEWVTVDPFPKEKFFTPKVNEVHKKLMEDRFVMIPDFFTEEEMEKIDRYMHSIKQEDYQSIFNRT